MNVHPTKPIAMLGLLQVVCAVSVLAFSLAFNKTFDKMRIELPTAYHLTQDYGYLLLIPPVMWTLFATQAISKSQENRTYYWVIGSGIGVFVLLIFWLIKVFGFLFMITWPV